MTSLNVLHTYDCNNVTCLRRSQFSTVIRVHFHHAANTLSFTCRRVKDGVTLVQLTRVNTYERQSTETVVHDFERQRTERLVNRYSCNFTGRFTSFFVSQILWINFSRRRQEVYYCVQNQLNTFVFESRTTISREECQITGTFTDTTLDVFQRRLFTFHVSHHKVIVLLNGSFDHHFTIFVRFINHVGRDINYFVVFWQARVIPDVCFHVQQVNNTCKLVFDTDWQGHYQRVSSKYFLNLANNTVEICTHTVQFVYEDYTGNF